MNSGVADWFGRLARRPLVWIIAVAALLRTAGLFWGLPASDGWDSDGIAPRDFLVGVVQTYSPGDYYTYPPLHLLVLTILTLPGWVSGLLHASSLAPHDLVIEFINSPLMTYFAITARLVSAMMSIGTIIGIAKITEEIGGRRSATIAAAFCALNATLTYYGQTTNLDGPYLFWSIAAVLFWVRTVSRRDLGQLRWALLCAAASIATKDQAYAIVLLSVPVTLMVWLALDPWARRNAVAILAQLLKWGALSLVLLLLIDGAITNPSGFLRRLAFLSGPASQDHGYYSRDVAGYAQLLRDAWSHIDRFYPAPLALLGLAGIAGWLAGFRRESSVWIAGLVPLMAAVSFTIAFNFVALREENRFLLPQSVFMAVYAALATDWLISSRWRVIAWTSRIGSVLIGAIALMRCIAIDAALIDDPRYAAERWLPDHVRPGDRIETYGPNSYLPRFAGIAGVTRIDDKPVDARSPLPGVVEIAKPYEDVESRSPRFIIVSAVWATRYLSDPDGAKTSGHISSEEQQRLFGKLKARDYFRDLHAGKLRYRLSCDAVYRPDVLQVIHVHESIGETIRIFERIDD